MGVVDKFNQAVSNDVIGAMFADQMSLGSFGPDRRSKEASILDEMSAEQIANYTAEELVTLLVQRETVQQVIAESRGQARSYRPIPLARRQYPDDDRSWVPSQKFECQHKVCLACCQRGGEENSHEKAWVSLDAVLNDDVSPSLATGFSFSPEGTRPFVDANILKNMDYRVAPPGGGIG
ncbi:hypothetical protein N658DRAFT_491572 [Parathielavia hyrcaniae]|uniref:Uncharacterized protein n=1 Tax=Parathielavia hyrcaniae TaxID=113614 RepID=A0AAN6T6U5_9PEZI|nr:hypothetical protein N658DRAFT_491572 [Parathielavia hyrcaniae]